MTLREVIKRPVVSEKSYDQIELNKYTFEVSRQANKIEIKNEIEEAFKVTVTGVNTSYVKAKSKRLGWTRGTTRGWKKAIVTLKPGDKIEFFEAK